MTVSLEDVATSTLTTLGMLAEAHQTGVARPRVGNAVYGSFGSDFSLADGIVVMVAAITGRHVARAARGDRASRERSRRSEARCNADFSDEGDRFRHRQALVALLQPWFAERDLEQVGQALDATHILWSPFRRLTDLAGDVADGRSPVAQVRDEEGLGANVVTTGPLRLRGEDDAEAAPAPTLGADTADVLGRNHDEWRCRMTRLAQTEGLDDEQRDILRTVRAFVDREVIPHASALEHADEFPADIVEGMRELGLVRAESARGVRRTRRLAAHLCAGGRGAVARLDEPVRGSSTLTSSSPIC